MFKPNKFKYTFHHNMQKPTQFKSKAMLTADCYGLIAKQNGFLTAAQLSAATLTIKRKAKSIVFFTTRVMPQFPVTKRAAEQPLGRGKGPVSF